MTGTATLFLRINSGKRSTFYQIVPIEAHPNVATKAWKLWKSAKVWYDVAVNDQGLVSCSCGDAVFRSRPCKHIMACKALGLLPRTT